MKSEPDDFSIDDLESSPNQTAHWDGVRNYQARNILRDEIKKGDGVLFYHSSAQPIGIAGVCEVVREGYPDHTARDKSNEHYDAKATEDNPIWYMVDVKLVRRLPEIITLKELKDTGGLEKMMVTQRGARLSVQPVKPSEWKTIMKLIDSRFGKQS
ncbi:EVE domain-containing protein [candidate division GN15 bacterium]|nr:EVE domain-containing protein [candidate division GN15 bacterium]